MPLRGRAKAAAIAWFCSKCTTRNSVEAERCSNVKCALSRKVVGVDILESDEAAERDVEHQLIACGEKRRRCGECAGCNAEECGVCDHCRDMPKRGGKGLKRQPCMRRICDYVREGGAEREANRLANLEHDRERREVARAERLVTMERERGLRLEQKLAAREARLREMEESKLAREESKLARAQARSERAVTHRRPAGHVRHGLKLPEQPTDLASYGWGAHRTFAVGAAVEVLGVEAGLCGACFAAQVVQPTEVALRSRPTTKATPPPNHIFFPPAFAAEGSATAEGSAAAPGSVQSGDGSRSSAAPAPAPAPPAPPSSAAAAAAPPPTWVWVEYFDLHETEDESSPLLREWTATSLVRLRPPRAPAGFVSLIRPGDKVQLLLDDCHWDVTLDQVDPSPASSARPFVVASVLYAASHRVRPDELRPMWVWGGYRAEGSGGSSSSSAPPPTTTPRPRWKYMLAAGTGVGVGDEAEDHLFLSACDAPRRHSIYYHTHGRREREACGGAPELGSADVEAGARGEEEEDDDEVLVAVMDDCSDE